MPTAILLLSCPDRRGLVSAVADFVLAHGGNVLHAEQHVDQQARIFFQRVEFDLDGVDLRRDQIATAFAPVAERFGMQARVHFDDDRPRIAILASRQPHCLADLLVRHRTGELPGSVEVVISNHPDHADLAAFAGVPFRHLPVGTDTAGKTAQEAAVLATVEEYGVELIVLARYMQILSGAVLERYRDRIVNIHHSFLPAFVGARPYHQAQERGVKLIGATAHYATRELDEGPIIAQDVVPVSHRDGAADLARKGRDLETVVLARAVRAHLERRTLVFGNKTVVFG